MNHLPGKEELGVPHAGFRAFYEEDRQRFRSEPQYEIVAANGLKFLIDTIKPDLHEGSLAVFPHHDEATDILHIAESLGATFEFAIDAFGGGGHSLLPILDNGLAKRGIAIDINPRAIRFARLNAFINELSERAYIREGDVRKDLPEAYFDNVLFLANPPFALHAAGVALDPMRDGGPNGLSLTLAFVERALEKAKAGNVIIGVTYSRIRQDGDVEFTEKLDELVSGKGHAQVDLVAGAPIWREFDGVKRQPNPMPLIDMRVKARPDDEVAKRAYDAAALMHEREGYDRLGYFKYVIRVGEIGEVVKSAKTAVEEALSA